MTMFSVIKTDGMSLMSNSSKLTFDVARVNTGGAMNIATGEFTVPYGGTYAFYFSALMGNKQKIVQIQILKNESVLNYIFDNNHSEATKERHDNINYHWMLNLSTGDVIRLHLDYGVLYTSTGVPVIFSGHLLHLS